MAETVKLAVPTMGKAGLDAQRSGHFGHCDCFTLIDIVDGELTNVAELDNPPHEVGGCIAIVDLLKEQGVQAIAAAGMGMRPMQGFANAGIEVFFDTDNPKVGQVAQLVAEGKLPNMTADQACRH